jgi:hypothetical protein
MCYTYNTKPHATASWKYKQNTSTQTGAVNFRTATSQYGLHIFISRVSKVDLFSPHPHIKRKHRPGEYAKDG